MEEEEINENEHLNEEFGNQETITKVTGMYKDWFLDYASYVILERAVPAIKDGFKPVQRRIMHSMKDLDDGRYNKVANVVGHTMQYHPHGDASISDALVQLGQKELLIDMQGNWGNILTGDRAAAARYIEARLSKFALDVVFNPKTTEWQSSYDGRKKEPIDLPVKFPLLLAQGAEGIAVGLSTKILPHNFNELIDASIKHLKGKPFMLIPDFLTGGIADVSNYHDGKRGGKIRVRAKIEVSMERGTFNGEGSNPDADDSKIETVQQLLTEYTTKESIKKADGGYADRNRSKPVAEALGKYSIHTLTSKHLSQYKANRLAGGYSPQTVTHELNVLHRAYVVAVEEWGITLRAPIPKARRPALPSGRENRITPAMVKKIRDNTESPELGDIVEFAIETCMRREEIVLMKWEDVNLERRSVVLPKTKTTKLRTIPLSTRALEVIQALPGEHKGTVFHMAVWSVSQAFKRAVDRAELGHLVFHDTRHEGISRLFEKGLNVIEVARISGHKTLSQLDRYTHLDVAHLGKKLRAR